MHVIALAALKRAAESYRDAEGDLRSWIRIVGEARWTSLVELKRSFPDADYVAPFVVFNIRHNRYRLIAKVHYVRVKPDGHLSEGHIYVKAFLTHKEYDRQASWK